MTVKTVLLFVTSLALSACLGAPVYKPVSVEALSMNFEDTKPEFSVPYTRPVSEIFLCLEKFFFLDYQETIYEISEDGKSGKLIAEVKSKVLPAVYELNGGIAVLKLPYNGSFSLQRKWTLGGAVGMRDLVINKSRDKCIW